MLLTRREALVAGAAAGLATTLPLEASETIATRPIPGSDESLPVIGLGNSNAFRRGDIPASIAVLERLRDFGGRYVDAIGPSRFVVAKAAREAGFDELFAGTYFDLADETQARDEADQLATALGRERLDAALCFTDQVEAHWDSVRAMKDAGLVRHIGTARHTSEYYDTMIRLMKTGTVDLLQVNYSMLEPEAEKRVLPVAQEYGVAVLINRPFINGRYFQLVRDKALPEWAADFDCESWAQFSLKFIISHPAVSCVLTETENPRHAEDNLRAGFGRLPDEATRQKMRKTLESLV